MLTNKDIRQIEGRGSSVDTIKQQIENFKKGFPFLQLKKAATSDDGIIRLTPKDLDHYTTIYDQQLAAGLKPLKFIPASGAASRMFKALFTAKEELENGKSVHELLKSDELKTFFGHLKDFAFCSEIEKVAGENINDLSELEILNLLLTEKGINYGSLPKGLLIFHSYEKTTRTPMEEHMVEGALYSKDKDGIVNLHFTVSPEHQDEFSKLLEQKKASYENTYHVQYNISFSQQKPETDTIAVDLTNHPFREPDGSLLFRPAGHGALLKNLNELDADIFFIKNIDNVVPDRLKEDTVNYKKALAGILLNLQEKIFFYQEKFNTHHYYGLDSAFFAEAANFLENILNVHPPQNLYYTEKEDLFQYLKAKFNRPIRVCGMVKNEGEPGGGPFFAVNSDNSVSLQIAESSQIDPTNQEQQSIAQKATHFNPVDLVCATKNYRGEKFNLSQFSDPDTGFISVKSKDGKELKAQELPGLWNGAMTSWNTLFIEVPIQTFNPVKTVNDLLRKEHQSN